MPYSVPEGRALATGADVLLGERRGRAARGRGVRLAFFIDNLLGRIHFITVMIRWTGLAPFPFPGSLTATFQTGSHVPLGERRGRPPCGRGARLELPPARSPRARHGGLLLE